MINTSAFHARAALVCFAVLIAACSREHTQKTVEQANAAASPPVIYPVGIVPPVDWTSSMREGVYASDAPKTCCFLAGNSLLTLDNPPGSQLAVFTFYVPSVKPLLENRERVSASFNGIPAGAPADLSTGMQDVTFTIPTSLRQKRHLTASLAMSVKWVPKNIGLNADRRELSVMLVRVGYI